MATILLVEDNEPMRVLTRAKLRGQFTVLCAGDGLEALEILDRRQVDLMIADVMMPRMDGYALVKRIRANGNQIPVLLLTAAFFPISLTLIGCTYVFARQFNRHVSVLEDGLRRVAAGDFSVRMKPEEGKPLENAYADFNKMVEELQSVQTLREDFINNFSHEFKTPITAVKGFAELLMEPGTTEEERGEYLRIIRDESSRLAELTNSTFLLSRLESQRVIPDRRPFFLDEQLRRCVILLAGSWEEKRMEPSLELEPIQYNGNEDLTQQVWLNLLSNAIRHTPPGGEIGVSLHAEGGGLAVRVWDTGEGMSPEVLAHIFDKYYQGDSSKKSQSLGLGLSIVHRITELCGGRIEVESEPGQGSSFTVYLPKET